MQQALVKCVKSCQLRCQCIQRLDQSTVRPSRLLYRGGNLALDSIARHCRLDIHSDKSLYFVTDHLPVNLLLNGRLGLRHCHHGVHLLLHLVLHLRIDLLLHLRRDHRCVRHRFQQGFSFRSSKRRGGAPFFLFRHIFCAGLGAHILVGSRKDLFLRDACLYLFTYGGGHAAPNRLFLFAHLCFRLCAGGPSCLLLHLYLYSSCHFCRHFCAGLFRCGFQRRAADLLLYIRQNGGIVFARHWGIAETGPRQ